MTNVRPHGPVSERFMRHYYGASRPRRPARGHWSVTVRSGGDEIVTMESNHLSGRELSDEDREIIRVAARSLLAFVGDAVAIDAVDPQATGTGKPTTRVEGS